MLSRQNQAIILWILLSLTNDIKFSQQQHLVNNAQSNNYNSPLTIANQQKLPTQTNVSSLASPPVGGDPSNGVDDILKDTILLLDVLDEKLNVVKNKTPNALMRDNLRALDGANDDESDSYPHQQHQSGLISRRASQLELRKHQSAAPVLAGRNNDQEQLARRLDEEASIEEALLRMADGFASGRRNDHDTANELLIAAASATNLNGAEPIEPQPQQQLPKHLIDHISDDVSPSLSSGPAIAEPNGQQASTPQGSMTAPSVTAAAAGSSRGLKRARQLTMAGAATAAEDNYLLASDSTERHIKFTLDLMQSIFTSQSYSAKTNLIESFLISPLSIQMVLMMMHLGARGQTRREISNCLHLTAAASTIPPSILQLPSSASSSSSASPSQSNADKSNLMQIVGNVGAASVAGNDLAAAAAAAAAVDSMGSKLKRRHQQQVSSENAKQQSSTVNNVGNSNSKSQQQSRHQQQQQLLPSAASNAPAATSMGAASGASGGGGNNPHELFSGAMRNLLKDPIVMKSLTSANQIFLQKNLPLSAQYEWAIKHYYGADIKLVDFQHQSSSSTYSNEQLRNSKLHGGNDGALNSTSSLMNNVTSLHEHHPQQQQQHQKLNGARGGEEQLNGNNNNIQQMVNDWIERQTKGKISNFLSSPISTSTLMMAINVLYFKGDWQYKFDPSDTETDAWFTQANGKTVKIPMMVNRLPLAFAHDPAMKTSVIELPYKAQRLGLFLLLPDEVSGIFHTMQMLNSTSFANLISSMRKPAPGADQAASGINVRIPKFSIESSPRLSQILSQQLGLKSLFMPDVADLSGMFGPLQQQSKRSTNGNLSNPQQQLHNNNNGNENNNNYNNNQQVPLQVGLDELLHKAVLQVDEQGSVAAASSATIVERVGLFNNNYFEADHPFLLFLMDKQTGLVLFSGAFAGNNNNHETQQQRH